jgi:hypothetical protein
MLNDAVKVVEPIFDHPADAAPVSQPLSVGSRVSLIYQGTKVPVRIEAIERLGTSFVGRIRGSADDLPLVRFRLKDVASFD